VTLIYTLTVFTSAFLLFLIQPIISKLLLPHLGGSPAVWNTAMMFFQIFLLLGYVYTHLTARWLGARKQSLLHIVLLVISLAWLPIALKTDIRFSSSEYPISWLVLSLFLSIGMPFFFLSANAPLIQFWMANTTHKHSKNPYFLYSASNIGSLLALISYPFLIEPIFTLSDQTANWSILFLVYIALVVGCIWYLNKFYKNDRAANVETSPSAPAPTAKQKLYWVALAFFPSSLMLGVTSFITTDIASIPLFWVIPLTLYLVTFIIAFSKYNFITDRAIQAQNILVPLVAFTMVFKTHFMYAAIILHLATFFVIAMVCHGILARSTPSTKHLTEFYVWLSFGGMLGGIFNALIAPNIFSTPIEYILALLGCLLVRPLFGSYSNAARERKLDILIPVGFGVCLFIIYCLIDAFLLNYASFLHDPNSRQSLAASPVIVSNTMFAIMVAVYVFIMVFVDKSANRPVRFALLVTSLFIASHFAVSMDSRDKSGKRLYTDRNFFGVTKVTRHGEMVIMSHGTTDHGMQSRKPEHKGKLASYYVPLKPVLKNLAPGLHNHPYAVIGLGSGTSACAGHKGQTVDFYEIDPAVVRMATDPELFTYLKDCPTTAKIILGDGRMEIAKASDKRYGLIVVDAFSSDAIPVHLLTREALAIYGQKLSENGVIALHLSNRHLNLKPVAASLAQDANFHAILFDGWVPGNDLSYDSSWVFLTRDAAYFDRIRKELPGSQLIQGQITIRPWTDNYSNILNLLM
jgi:hypothetical protein